MPWSVSLVFFLLWSCVLAFALYWLPFNDHSKHHQLVCIAVHQTIHADADVDAGGLCQQGRVAIFANFNDNIVMKSEKCTLPWVILVLSRINKFAFVTFGQFSLFGTSLPLTDPD